MSITVLSGQVVPAQAGAGPGTALINKDSYIFEIGAGNTALNLFLGGWTITVNGGIYSDSGKGIDVQAPGTGASKLSIGATGSVWGGTTGAELNALTTVTNAGIIGGGTTAIKEAATGNWSLTNTATGRITGGSNGLVIAAEGVHTITNAGYLDGGTNAIDDQSASSKSVTKLSNTSTGQIIGTIQLSDGNDVVSNKGFVYGSFVMGAGNDTVTNTNYIQGAVLLGEGTNKITSSGQIGGVVGGTGNDTIINSGTSNSNFFLDAGDDIVINSGSVTNGIDLGAGNNTMKNSGTIDGLAGGADNDTVTNTGSLNGDLTLGAGTNKLTNSGTITGNVSGGADADTIVNSGTLGALINLGGGNDVFTNFAGKKSGAGVFNVDLGDGDDKFSGGSNSERIVDSNGADTVKLGAGNDGYTATGASGPDGNDIIDGGTNTKQGEGNGDYYDAEAATNAVFINLDTVAQTDTFLSLTIAASTAYGLDISGKDDPLAGGFTKDTITNFEDAWGGSGDDVLFGTKLGNALGGGDGHDHLFGGDGNDSLYGGGGSDDLVGGKGRDYISFGDSAGSDGFKDRTYYNAITESGITAATRDVLHNFVQGEDFIILTAIDANTANGALTNDTFNFIGMNVGFTLGQAGQLRGVWLDGDTTLVEADVNGDNKVDFSIEMDGHFSLTAGDFGL